MPKHKNKEVKATSKYVGRETALDQLLVPSKYGLLSIVSIVIIAWFFWRILQKYRRIIRKEISQNGYILANGQFEHRLIAERVLGRKLVWGEVVHHINGIKTDNRKSNLCVLDNDAHNQFHDWIKQKREKDGRYPTENYQRAVLRDHYNGILLVAYPNELPPLDAESQPKRGGNVS